MPEFNEGVAAAVQRLSDRAMIQIRGDLESEAIASAISASFGVVVPKPHRILTEGARQLAWMSPDELLGMLPLEDGPAVVDSLADQLAEHHHMIAEVGSMRCEFALNGAVRDILAKGTPADVSPEAFSVGHFRRSRIGQLQAAFWLISETRSHVLCRRSEAEYFYDWLVNAADMDSAPRYFHTG